MGLRAKNLEKMKQFSKLVEFSVRDAIQVRVMKEIAELMAELIKQRTRNGFGVTKPEGKAKRLKKLSDATKEARRALSRRGGLSSETTPGKSNLTQSGEMLNSLRGRTRGEGKAVVTVLDKRKDGKSNIKISGAHQFGAKAGRKRKVRIPKRAFLNLSKSETKKTIQLLERLIEEKVRKNLIKIR